MTRGEVLAEAIGGFLALGAVIGACYLAAFL